ncbi:MAG TPA: alkene reductase [Pseudomonadales bacterium]
MSKLFEPVTLGALQLKNRLVMAPLTRCRAGVERLPNALMRDYYCQRAGAGLILSEATSVTPMGVGYPDTPGIWSQQQAAAWKTITDAVHQAGSLMMLQLWHVGRISHPMFLDGELPVAPSAIRPAGRVSLVRPETDYVTPRALETAEIAGVVDAFRQAAVNARAAGFDGVEIHAANGYLIDQFLQDSTNQRTDQYGGTLENRARLLLEITDAVVDVWGADRVGVHLAPRGDAADMGDSDPRALFTYVAGELGKRAIAFVFVREYLADDSLLGEIKQAFGGPVIANERLEKADAEKLLASGVADAVAFGCKFLANPDLPARLAGDAPLNEVNWQTVYAKGAEGYTDYPALA